MAVDVKDRVPTKPNRRKITFDDGTVVYANIEYADEPTEQGTPINRELFQKVAADVPSFKNLGYLGSYTSQEALDSKLDSLKGDNYGHVSNLVCSLGVDFQSSHSFGWAAGCTVLVNGGGDYCSQVLTGSTGTHCRSCNGGVWEAWGAINRGTVLWEGEIEANTDNPGVSIPVSGLYETIKQYKFIEIWSNDGYGRRHIERFYIDAASHLNRANFSVQRRADGSVNETTSSLSMRFSSGGIVIDGRAGTLEVRKFPLITFDISALGKISEIKWDWGDCCTLNKIVGYK